MKLIMESWRKYINENELNEAAKGITDLPKGTKIYIDESSDEVYIECDFFGNLSATLIAGCGKNIYAVEDVYTKDGWGPFIYDLAMEYVTSKGGGITASKGSSTNQLANKIWKYYDSDARMDVQSEPLPEGCPKTRMKDAAAAGGFARHEDSDPYLNKVYRKDLDLLDLLKGVLKISVK